MICWPRLVEQSSIRNKLMRIRIYDGWLHSPHAGALPKQKLIKLGMTLKFLDSVKYGKSYAFQDLPQATKFYHGHSLTVARTARGMGLLGKELISRTMKMAQERGCSHVYILATSLYSQRIFQNLGKIKRIKSIFLGSISSQIRWVSWFRRQKALSSRTWRLNKRRCKQSSVYQSCCEDWLLNCDLVEATAIICRERFKNSSSCMFNALSPFFLP